MTDRTDIEYCDRCRMRMDWWESFTHDASGAEHCADCLQAEAKSIAQEFRDENDRPASGAREARHET